MSNGFWIICSGCSRLKIEPFCSQWNLNLNQKKFFFCIDLNFLTLAKNVKKDWRFQISLKIPKPIIRKVFFLHLTKHSVSFKIWPRFCLPSTTPFQQPPIHSDDLNGWKLIGGTRNHKDGGSEPGKIFGWGRLWGSCCLDFKSSWPSKPYPYDMCTRP